METLQDGEDFLPECYFEVGGTRFSLLYILESMTALVYPLSRPSITPLIFLLGRTMAPGRLPPAYAVIRRAVGICKYCRPSQNSSSLEL
jgi:hypothetical protein